MRDNIVFAVLLALLAVLGVSMVARNKPAHLAPKVAEPQARPTPSASAAPEASVKPAAKKAGKKAKAPKKNEPLFDRELRVVALGWDVATPGLMASEKVEGQNAFQKAGLDVTVAAAPEMSDVEHALARGGADSQGADIAIAPLPRFVASYDKLKALNPAIFFVVGWSAGREVLASSEVEALSELGEGETLVRGAGGDPAALLALFALELEGVPPADVRFVAPDDAAEDRPKPTLLAINKSHLVTDDAKQAREHILLTTSDAARLVPLVAFCQKNLLDEHEAALAAWARVWMSAQRTVRADATVAARKVGARDDAPEPLTLLSRLGEITPAELYENAEVFGLSGRGAVTLASLFGKSWQLWRDAQVLTSPAPELPPVTGQVVLGLARSDPSLLERPKPKPVPRDPDAGAPDAGAADGTPALTHDQKKLDDERLMTTAGFLAGVFPRAELRISLYRGVAPNTEATASFIERLVERYGVDADRIVAGTARGKPGVAARLEVLPAR